MRSSQSRDGCAIAGWLRELPADALLDRADDVDPQRLSPYLGSLPGPGSETFVWLPRLLDNGSWYPEEFRSEFDFSVAKTLANDQQGLAAAERLDTWKVRSAVLRGGPVEVFGGGGR